MSNVDVQSRRSPVQAIAPATFTGDITGDAVNVAEFAGAMAVVNPGTIASGTFTPKLQHSFDGVVWDDVPASEVQGAFVDLVSDTPQKVGLVITRRLLRIFVTTSGGPSGEIGAYINHASPGLVGALDLLTGNTPVLQGPLSLQAPQRDLLYSKTPSILSLKSNLVFLDGAPWASVAVQVGDWVNFPGTALARPSKYLVLALDEDVMKVAPPGVPFELLVATAATLEVSFDATADLGLLGSAIAMAEANSQTEYNLTGAETWSGLGVAVGDTIRFESSSGWSPNVDGNYRVAGITPDDKNLVFFGGVTPASLDTGTADIRLIKRPLDLSGLAEVS